MALLEAKNEMIAQAAILKQQETHIRTLQEALKQRDSALQQVATKFNETSRDFTKLHEENRLLKQTQEDLKESLSRSNIELEDLRIDFNEKQDMLARLEAENENLRRKDIEHREVVGNLMGDVESLKKSGASFMSSIDSQIKSDSSMRLTDLESDVAALHSQREKELEQLRHELDEMYGEQIVRMKSQFTDKLSYDTNRLKTEIDRLTEENKRFQGQAEQWQKQYFALAQQNISDTDLLTQIGSLTNENIQYKVQLDEMNHRVQSSSKYQVEINEMKVKIQVLMAEKESLNNELSSAKQNINSLRGNTHAQIKDEIESLNVQLKKMTDDKDTCVGKLKLVQNELDNRNKMLQDLQSQHMLEMQAYKDKCEEVMNQEREQLNASLHQMQSAYQELHTHAMKLQEDVTNSQTSSEQSALISKLQLEIEKLKQEHQTYLNDLQSDHTQEIFQLKASYSGALESVPVKAVRSGSEHTADSTSKVVRVHSHTQETSHTVVERTLEREILQLEESKDSNEIRAKLLEIIAERDDALNKLKLLTSDYNLTKTEFSETIKERASAIERCQMLEHDRDSSLAQLNVVCCERDEYKQKLDQISSEKDTVQHQLNESFAERESLKESLHSQLEELTKDKSTVETQLHRISAEKERLHTHLGALKKERQALQTHFNLLVQERMETDDDFASAGDSKLVDQLRFQFDQMKLQFTKEMERTNQNCGALLSKLEQVTQEKQVIQTGNNEQLSLLTTAKESLNIEIDKLKAEYAIVLAQLESMHSSSEKQRSEEQQISSEEYAEVVSELQRLQTQLSQVSGLTTHSEALRGNLMQDLSSLKQDMANSADVDSESFAQKLLSQLEDAQRENELLKAKLNAQESLLSAETLNVAVEEKTLVLQREHLVQITDLQEQLTSANERIEELTKQSETVKLGSESVFSHIEEEPISRLERFQPVVDSVYEEHSPTRTTSDIHAENYRAALDSATAQIETVLGEKEQLKELHDWKVSEIMTKMDALLEERDTTKAMYEKKLSEAKADLDHSFQVLESSNADRDAIKADHAKALEQLRRGHEEVVHDMSIQLEEADGEHGVELSSLQKQCTEAKTTIQELAKEKEQLEQEYVTELNNMHEEYDTKSKNLRESLEEEVESLRAELTDVSSRLASENQGLMLKFEDEATQFKQEYELLHNKLQQVMAEKDMLESHRDELVQSLGTEHTSVVQKLMVEIEELTKTKSKLEMDYHVLSTKYQEHVKVVDHLQERLKEDELASHELMSVKDDLSEKLKIAEREAHDLSVLNHTLEGKVDALQLQVMSTEESATSTDAKSRESSDLVELRTLLDEADSRIAHLVKQKGQMEEEHTRMLDSLNKDHSEAMATLTSANTTLKEEKAYAIEALECTVGELHGQIHNLESKSFEDLQRKYDEMKAILTDEKQTIASELSSLHKVHETSIAELNTTIGQLKHENQELFQKSLLESPTVSQSPDSGHLSGQLRSLSDMKLYEQKLSIIERERDQLMEKERKETEAAVSQYQNQIITLTEEIARLASANEEFESKVASHDPDEVQFLQNEIARLKRNHEEQLTTISEDHQLVIESRNRDKQAIIDNVSHELDNLRKSKNFEIDQLNSQLNVLKSSIKESEQHHTSVREELESRIVHLEASRDELLSSTGDEADIIRQQFTAEIVHLNEKVAKLSMERESLVEDHKAMRERMVTEHSADIDKINMQHTSELHSTSNDHESALQQVTQDSQAEQEKMQEQIVILESQLTEAKQDMAELENTHKSELSDLMAKHESLLQEVRQKESELLEEIQNMREGAESQVKQLTVSQDLELKRVSETATLEMQPLRETISALSNEIESLRSEKLTLIDRYEKTLASAQEESEIDLKTKEETILLRLGACEEEISAYKAAEEDVTAKHNGELDSLKTEYEQKLTESGNSLSAYESEINALKMSVREGEKDRDALIQGHDTVIIGLKEEFTEKHDSMKSSHETLVSELKTAIHSLEQEKQTREKELINVQTNASTRENELSIQIQTLNDNINQLHVDHEILQANHLSQIEDLQQQHKLAIDKHNDDMREQLLVLENSVKHKEEDAVKAREETRTIEEQRDKLVLENQASLTDIRQQHSENITQYESTIKSLNYDKLSVHSALDTTTEKLAYMESKMNELVSEKQSLQIECDRVASDNQQYTITLADMETALQKMKEDNHSVLSVYDQHKTEVESIVADLNEQIMSLLSEKGTLQSDLSETSLSKTDLETTCAELTKKLSSAEIEIQKLDSELQTVALDKMSSLSTFEQVKAELEQVVEQLQEELNEVTAEKAALKEEQIRKIGMLRAESEESSRGLAEQITGLKTLYTTFKQKQGGLVSQLNEDIQVLQDERHDLLAKEASLKEELHRTQVELAETKSIVDQIHEDNELLQQEKQSLANVNKDQMDLFSIEKEKFGATEACLNDELNSKIQEFKDLGNKYEQLNSDFQSLQAEKDSSISEMKIQIDQLVSGKNTSCELVQSLQQEAAQNKDKILTMDSQIDQLSSDKELLLKDQESIVHTLQSQLEVHQTDKTNLQSDHDQLQSHFEVEKVEWAVKGDEYKSEIECLKRDLDQLKSESLQENENLTDKLSTLITEKEAMLVEQSRMIEDVTHVKGAELNSALQENQGLATMNNSLEKLNQEFQITIDQLRTEKDDLQRDLSHINDQNAELTSKLDGQKELVSILEGTVKDKDNDNDRLKVELAELTTVKDTKEQEYTDLQGLVSKLEANLAEKDHDNDRLKVELAELTTVKDTKDQENTDLKGLVSQLEANMTYKDHDNDRLRVELVELTSVKDTEEKENTNLKGLVSQLEANLAEKDHDNDSLKIKLVELTSVKDTKEQENTNLQGLVSKLEANLAEKDHDNDRLKVELAELTTVKDTKDQENTDLQGLVSKLETNLAEKDHDNDRLKVELAELTTVKDTKDQEITGLKGLVSQLEANLTDKDHDNERLKLELVEQTAVKDEESANLKQTLETVQVELTEVARKLKESEQTVEKLHQNTSEQAASNHKYIEEQVEIMETLKKEHQADIDQLQTEYRNSIDSVQSEHAMDLDKVDQEQIASREQLMLEHQKELEQLAEKNKSVLSQQQQQHESETNVLEGKVQQLLQAVEEANAEHEKSIAVLKNREGQLSNAKS